ncbi:MAG: hypothetical protein IT332_03205 [Ardenticatenales bacterium]|nr:hypothetical protein [Ardenticatenales bacterium]
MNRIGVDVGSTADLDARLAAAAAVGARWVRMRFVLDERRVVDEAFLAAAGGAVDAAAAGRLRVLGVIDGGLTVAPDAAAADASVAPAVGAAWLEELVEHAALLAGALGDRVQAWEIVPLPNHAPAGRDPIPPARWAALLEAVGGAVRAAAPGATVVAGGLLCTPADDGVDYLRAAIEAGRWAVGTPPFDAIGIQLRLLPDGGVDEAAVAAAVAERTGRVWRAAAAALGRHAVDVKSVWATGMSWDADATGDTVQARNLWTAFDTLTADPHVATVIWTALTDAGAANGLFASVDLSPASVRPAWKAYHDFTQYARQISPPPSVLFDPTAPALVGLDDGPDGGGMDDGELLDAVAGAPVGVGSSPPAEARGGPVRFRVPTVTELLIAAGVPASDLDRTLDAIEERYGNRDWLPAGEYSLAGGAPPDVASDAASDFAPDLALDAASDLAPAPPAAPPTSPEPRAALSNRLSNRLSNQHILTAFYRAGGGSWSLLQRAGLDLADLVSHRDEPFAGPAIAQADGLTMEERAAVLGELNAEA